MGKKVQKKKRGAVDSPDQSNFYNRPFTRSDTIGYIISDCEPDNSIIEHKGIPQILISRSCKPRRVLTRDMIELLKANQVQKSVECEFVNAELRNSNLSHASSTSIQNLESQNTLKSSNSSIHSLSSFKGHTFQDPCISEPDSLVNVQLVDSQDMNNEITEFSRGFNKNKWVQEPENGFGSNNTSLQSLSSLNSNLYQDICISKLDSLSSVHERAIVSQDGTSEVGKSNLNGTRNISIQDSESENSLTSSSTSFYSSKSCSDHSFQDIGIYKPESVVHKQLVDAQVHEKQINEHDKEVNYNQFNPNLENIDKANINYLQNLTSPYDNPYQNVYPSMPSARVLVRQIDRQRSENQLTGYAKRINYNVCDPQLENRDCSNNNYLHNFSSPCSNPYQYVLNSMPRAQAHMRQIDSQEPETQITGHSKSVNYNIWNPESQTVDGSNNNCHHNWSSLHGNPYQDNSNVMPNTKVLMRQVDPKGPENQITGHAKRFNNNMRNQELQTVDGSNNNYLHNLSSPHGNPYQDIFNNMPQTQVHMQQVDPKESVKQITGQAKGVNSNIWNPESKNEDRLNNNYFHKLSSSQCIPHQDNYTFIPQAQVHTQIVDPQEPNKQTIEHTKESNSNMWNPESGNVERWNKCYLHNLSSFSANPYQDICTCKPSKQVHKQQVHSGESESHLTEFAEGFNLNKWMENAIDSVAAVVLPYVP